jgi:hypothetical protein
LELKEVVEEAFEVENRYDFFDKHRKVLTYLASDNASRGVSVSKDIKNASIKNHQSKLKELKAYNDSLLADNKETPKVVNSGMFDFGH